MAQTLPAQPGGSGAPVTTRSERPGQPGASPCPGPIPAATSAVPSVLQSSTRMTVSAPG